MNNLHGLYKAVSVVALTLASTMTEGEPVAPGGDTPNQFSPITSAILTARGLDDKPVELSELKPNTTYLFKISVDVGDSYNLKTRRYTNIPLRDLVISFAYPAVTSISQDTPQVFHNIKTQGGGISYPVCMAPHADESVPMNAVAFRNLQATNNSGGTASYSFKATTPDISISDTVSQCSHATQYEVKVTARSRNSTITLRLSDLIVIASDPACTGTLKFVMPEKSQKYSEDIAYETAPKRSNIGGKCIAIAPTSPIASPGK